MGYTDADRKHNESLKVYEIKNIRRGKGERSVYIYAELYIDEELSISATLDYITEKIFERM